MFLRSLTIKGFKSFADPVTIDLSPGVSVIVGPNGSGKSNIADAIAWVLGAQGPKTVRSSKMDDVIFAGAGKRSPLGRAEVSIVIDNSDHGLELDLTEVTITRTLFRSGESEYSLNGNSCRLIDLQDLLSDAGVGRQQHVIISQGQLDIVLNARSEERRGVIEEAAGITKFKRRRERTERRLASMEGDLLRAEDLVREVKRQIRPLAKQAAKAKRQLELRDRTTHLKRYIAGAELRALEEMSEAVGAELVDAEVAVLELQNEMSQLDKTIASLEGERLEVSAEDLFDLITRSEAMSERFTALSDIARQKRRSLSEKLKAADRSETITVLEIEANALRAEMESTEADIIELESELNDLEKEEADFRLSETPDIADKVHELNKAFSVATRENASLSSRRSALAVTIQRLRTEEGNLESRRSRLQAQLNSKTAELDQVKGEIERTEEDLEEKASSYDAQAKEVQAAAEQLERALSAYSKSEVVVKSLQAKVSAFASAIEEGRSKTQARALKNLAGFLGALIDVIEITEGYEKAFAAAVQGLTSSVLTRDSHSALEGLRYLKMNDLEGSVISVDQYLARAGGDLDGPLPRLPDLRSRVSVSRGEIGRFLDLILSKTFVVGGSLDEAIGFHKRFPALIFVTTDGERLGPDGYWTASMPMTGTGLALERATRELESEEREYTARESELESLRTEHGRVSSQNDELRTEVVRLREELARLGSLPGRLGSDVDLAIDELESIEAEAARLSGLLRSAEFEDEQLEPEFVESNKVLSALGSEIGEIQLKMKEQYSARRSLDQRGAELELRAARLEQSRLGLERAIESVAARLAGEIENQQTSADDIGGWGRALVGLDHVISKSDSLQAGAAEVCEGAKASRQQLMEIARLRQDRLGEARTRRLGVESQLENKREALQLSNIRRSETRVRLETMAEQVRRELGIEAEIARSTPVPEGVVPSQAEPVLRELEQELASLGPINELAELELSELNEKAEFLESQLADIKSSRRELGTVIRSIDSEMLQVFEGAVKDVAERFSSLFAQLFQGGKGRLVLSEPSDPLQSGLEIEVTLPGKSVKRLSLLSGGERSLVALAFLFSVFESRPSPFYILDEVEAALDDINLNRFLRLITNFGKTSQLLVISHQKKTMEVADRLFGVTMQEGGTTKVISQRMTRPASDLR